MYRRGTHRSTDRSSKASRDANAATALLTSPGVNGEIIAVLGDDELEGARRRRGREEEDELEAGKGENGSGAPSDLFIRLVETKEARRGPETTQ